MAEWERFSGFEMFSKEELYNCQCCELYRTRKNVLCGEGNLSSDLIFIAQAPGEKEDKEGRMFLGPAGKIFRKLLQKNDIDISKIYMTNLIKCKLPQNRRPKQREIKACAFFLDQEITKVDPKILIPLGYYATKYLFQKYDLSDFSKTEFHDMIGNSYPVKNIKILVLSHPAALLYNEDFQEKAFLHYQKIAKI